MGKKGGTRRSRQCWVMGNAFLESKSQFEKCSLKFAFHVDPDPKMGIIGCRVFENRFRGLAERAYHVVHTVI
jgi:hypothetical protein